MKVGLPNAFSIGLAVYMVVNAEWDAIAYEKQISSSMDREVLI